MQNFWKAIETGNIGNMFYLCCETYKFKTLAETLISLTEMTNFIYRRKNIKNKKFLNKKIAIN